MTFQPKPPVASKIWLGIIAVVLCALFFETRDPRQAGQNFIVNTDSDGVGAEVLIDNQKVGTVQSCEAAGLGGGVFRAYLGSGKHELTVRKNGFRTINQHLEMKREAFVGVDLQPSTH
jgi:hypothetical protein